MNEKLQSMSPDELRSIRAALTRTQTQMAAALGIGLRGYQHWEDGTRAMPAARANLARNLLAQNAQSAQAAE